MITKKQLKQINKTIKDARDYSWYARLSDTFIRFSSSRRNVIRFTLKLKNPDPRWLIEYEQFKAKALAGPLGRLP